MLLCPDLSITVNLTALVLPGHLNVINTTQTAAKFPAKMNYSCELLTKRNSP